MASNSTEVQKKADAKRAGRRSRNWAVVLYPDSAPENWAEVIGELQIRAVCSPLHDKDVNPDGEVKKAHRHLLLMFDSVKTQEQVMEIAEALNAPRPQQMDSAVGTARYLCHLDNPDKAQYNVEDVIEFGGADYKSLIARVSDKYNVIGEIMVWCDDHRIYSFAALMRYSLAERPDWFRCLSDNCGWAVKEFLKSALWELENEEKLRIQQERSTASKAYNAYMDELEAPQTFENDGTGEMPA